MLRHKSATGKKKHSSDIVHDPLENMDHIDLSIWMRAYKGMCVSTRLRENERKRERQKA